MQTVEFRVRPVIRHIVTRYTQGEPTPAGTQHDDSSKCASLETLGEFGNEGYADIVAEALRERVAPREYVLVQVTVGEVNAKVYYAYSEGDVSNLLQELRLLNAEEHYRVFERISSKTLPA